MRRQENPNQILAFWPEQAKGTRWQVTGEEKALATIRCLPSFTSHQPQITNHEKGRLFNRPFDHFFPLLTGTFLLLVLTSAVLGSLTVRTPFLYSAFTFSVSTVSGTEESARVRDGVRTVMSEAEAEIARLARDAERRAAEAAAQPAPAAAKGPIVRNAPALTDDGVTMIESAAICLYLADKFPEQGLAPAVGTPARGTTRRLTRNPSRPIVTPA